MLLRLCCVVLFVAAAFAGPIDINEVEIFATSFLESESAASGLNVSSLIVSAGASRESKITLGDANEDFLLAVKPESGEFEIRHQNQRSFAVTKEGNVEVFGKLTARGAVRVDGPLVFQGKQQWTLAAAEDFNMGASGWSDESVTTCGNPNKKVLGGYGKTAGGEVSKVFPNLPPHEYVRLKANYHFIDAWGGETAFVKMEHRIMWTDSFDQQSAKSGINVCGSAAPESKFSVPIDVILPHNCTAEESCSVTVAFGSTLTLSPTEQSFAVSDVMLYVR